MAPSPEVQKMIITMGEQQKLIEEQQAMLKEMRSKIEEQDAHIDKERDLNNKMCALNNEVQGQAEKVLAMNENQQGLINQLCAHMEEVHLQMNELRAQLLSWQQLAIENGIQTGVCVYCPELGILKQEIPMCMVCEVKELALIGAQPAVQGPAVDPLAAGEED